MGSKAGNIAAKYVPKAIAAKTAGAEKPTVAETNPPAKPMDGWMIRLKR